MDAHRRLTEQEVELALRKLFAENGRLVAPAGLETRIMGRLALEIAPTTKAAALIPRWVWIALGSGLCALMGYALLTPGGEPALEPGMDPYPIPGIAHLFTSTWSLMAATCGCILLALHARLIRMRMDLVTR